MVRGRNMLVAAAVVGMASVPVINTAQGSTISLSVSNAGGTVQLDSAANNEGFEYQPNPTTTYNTSNGVISAFTEINPTGGTGTETESGNIYYFQSNSPAISSTDTGIHALPEGPGDNSNGFSFTIANEPVDQTVNIYAGGYALQVLMTVTTTTGSTVSNNQNFGGNDYFDYTLTLPANSGIATITWKQTSANNASFSNPSIFAVTASGVPEPVSVATVLTFGGLWIFRRRPRSHSNF